MAKCKPQAAQYVTYTTDDGRDTYALVVKTNEDGSLNLAWLDLDNEAWHSANGVPADSDRLK